jgi:hypothetical protein
MEKTFLIKNLLVATMNVTAVDNDIISFFSLSRWLLKKL